MARANKALGTECVQGYVLVDKDDRYVGLTTLPPSFADCLEIVGTLRAYPGQLLSFISGMNMWAVHTLAVTRGTS